MPWTFNPFSGTFDQKGSGGGGGSSYLEGEVQNFSALPTATPPAIDAAYLVREAEGAWLLNRKPAGIYIRVATTGTRATDWTYAGEFPDVFSDDKFVLYDETDSSKNLVFQLSGISTGTTRTLTAPNANGRIALSNYAVVTSAQTLAAGSVVAADTTAGAFTLTLPASPANGDTVSILDYAGTFDTNALTIARNGSNIESLAENMDCNLEDAAFSLVYVGSTVGWRVVPYYGSKTSLASPDPIGSTSPNTGNFTTLTANSIQNTPIGSTTPNTVAATALSATPAVNTPALTSTGYSITGSSAQSLVDLAGTWNTTGTPIALKTNLTVTAAGANSMYADFQAGGYSQFGVARISGTSNALWLYNANSGTNTNGIGANYERGSLGWVSNRFSLIVEAAGSGSARGALLRVGTGQSILFDADVIECRSASFAQRLGIQSSGVVVYTSLLQFGGTTSSFPALKRSSTALQVRLADDSAYSVLDAQLRAQGTAPATSGATGTAGDIRYDADYIYVCTATNTWKRAAIATW
jgi:hypothetical protein